MELSPRPTIEEMDLWFHECTASGVDVSGWRRSPQKLLRLPTTASLVDDGAERLIVD